MPSDRTRTLTRFIAPAWLAALWFATLATGMAFYAAIFVLLALLLEAVAPSLEPMAFIIGFLAPFALALWLFRRASSVLYAREHVRQPTLRQHAWQCAFLYVVVAWTIYALAACSSGEPAIIRSYCTHPFGIGPAGGLVAFGGILGDLMALRQAGRRRSEPGVVAL